MSSRRPLLLGASTRARSEWPGKSIVPLGESIVPLGESIVPLDKSVVPPEALAQRVGKSIVPPEAPAGTPDSAFAYLGLFMIVPPGLHPVPVSQ